MSRNGSTMPVVGGAETVVTISMRWSGGNSSGRRLAVRVRAGLDAAGTVVRQSNGSPALFMETLAIPRPWRGRPDALRS